MSAKVTRDVNSENTLITHVRNVSSGKARSYVSRRVWHAWKSSRVSFRRFRRVISHRCTKFYGKFENGEIQKWGKSNGFGLGLGLDSKFVGQCCGSFPYQPRMQHAHRRSRSPATCGRAALDTEAKSVPNRTSDRIARTVRAEGTGLSLV